MPRRGAPKVPAKGPAAAEMRRLRREIARDFNGFAVRPSPTPPPITQAPWYNLVCTQQVTTPKDSPYELTYEISAIWTAAQLQLGFGDAKVLAELRFRRVEVWQVSDSSSAGVALFVYDVSDVTPNTRLFARVEDHCAKNQWARCGYEWPRSIQNITCESASTAPVFAVRSSQASQSIYTRVTLLWRATKGAVPSLHGAPRSESPFEPLD